MGSLALPEPVSSSPGQREITIQRTLHRLYHTKVQHTPLFRKSHSKLFHCHFALAISFERQQKYSQFQLEGPMRFWHSPVRDWDRAEKTPNLGIPWQQVPAVEKVTKAIPKYLGQMRKIYWMS